MVFQNQLGLEITSSEAKCHWVFSIREITLITQARSLDLCPVDSISILYARLPIHQYFNHLCRLSRRQKVVYYMRVCIPIHSIPCHSSKLLIQFQTQFYQCNAMFIRCHGSNPTLNEPPTSTPIREGTIKVFHNLSHSVTGAYYFTTSLRRNFNDKNVDTSIFGFRIKIKIKNHFIKLG